MTTKYTILVEKDKEGWLVSEVVGLPGCHTQGKTMDELLKRTKEAILAYIESEGSNGSNNDFVGIQQIEV